MNDPMIRIYLTPKGVQKIDAPVGNDQDRTNAFKFLADKASKAVSQLDARIKASVRSSR